MIDLAFLSFEVFDLKAQAFQKARVQIGIKEFAQRFHAAEIPTRFEHVGKVYRLFQFGHGWALRKCASAPRPERPHPSRPERVRRRTRRKLVQNGGRHLFFHGKARKFGRVGRHVFRHVVERRRKNDLPLFEPVFRRHVARHEREPQRMVAPQKV